MVVRSNGSDGHIGGGAGVVNLGLAAADSGGAGHGAAGDCAAVEVSKSSQVENSTAHCDSGDPVSNFNSFSTFFYVFSVSWLFVITALFLEYTKHWKKYIFFL